MKRFLKSHPLLIVILMALALRLPAVFYSKGYMASDDHYETILVAYNWLKYGFYGDNDHLRWRHHTDQLISRFPLYHFSLTGVMHLFGWCGVDSLNTIMYGIRFLHALLSLLSVWLAYRLVGLITRSTNWALVSGLMVAAHGLMPFLSVRNLLEMVSAPFLLAAVYLLYRFQYGAGEKLLFWSGVLTGLSWMIRFPVAMAALPIPFVLWWSTRRLRSAILYSAGVAVVLLASGMADYFVLGSFMSSTVGLLNEFSKGGEASYHTIRLIYPVVLLAFFIPPFSLVAFGMVAQKKIWCEQRLLLIPILSFVVLHTLLTNRQERFMIPIIPLLIVLVILALWYHYKAGGWFFRKKAVFHSVVGVSLAINFVLLAMFTFNYGHKGLVEPLVRMEKIKPRPQVMLVSPERHQIYPFYYAGYPMIRHLNVSDWSRLDTWSPREDMPQYFVLYPPSESDLPRYVDSVSRRVGPLREAFRVGPSTVDYILYLLNPKYNPTHEAWVYQLDMPMAVSDGS